MFATSYERNSLLCIFRIALTSAKERKLGSSASSMRLSKLTVLSGDEKKTHSVPRPQLVSTRTKFARLIQTTRLRKLKASVDTIKLAKSWLQTRSSTIQHARTRLST